MDILLVRAGALGDLLLLRRSVAALRGAGHRVRLLAPAAGDALVGPGPGEITDLLPWEASETAAILAHAPVRGPVADALASADVVIAWTRTDDLLRSLRCHARRLLSHDPAPPVDGPHASLWLARVLAPLGLDPATEPPPPLSFTSAEQSEAAARLALLPPRFLAIHPGSGAPSKNWPLERFHELAARWATRAFGSADPPRAATTLLWALGAAEIDRGLAEAAPAGALVAREWPRRVLGAALARAGLYVGNDSGASHLAAAAGAPTLAVFGPTDPAQWSPLGPHVRTLRAPRGSLGALTVDDVARAAWSLTSEASEPPSAR